MTLRRRLGRFVREHSAIVGSVVAVVADEPDVVLTYDDGPDPVTTRLIQDELEGAGFTATFFVLLTQARRHPDVVRETVARGHEVALHGVDHRALVGLPTSEVRRRCVDGRAELEDLAGAPVRWLRPPYGRQNLLTWHLVRRSGLEPVMWGPTLRDSKPMEQTERLDAAMATVRPGSIVLAHDRFATAEDGADDGAEPVIDRPELARGLISALQQRGFTGRSLENALTSGTAMRGAWFGG